MCVTVGPGSFTGIRVAISICKGLAIGTNAKIFTLSNFDIYSDDNFDKKIYILDGFSDYVYTRVNDSENTLDNCEHIFDIIEKIKTNYAHYKIFVQSEKLQSILTENDLNSMLVTNNIVEEFCKKIERDEFTEINKISPIYLRASQAEIERNKRLKEV